MREHDPPVLAGPPRSEGTTEHSDKTAERQLLQMISYPSSGIPLTVVEGLCPFVLLSASPAYSRCGFRQRPASVVQGETSDVPLEAETLPEPGRKLGGPVVEDRPRAIGP